MYYRTYTCISNLIHVIHNLYLSYGTYTSLTELILVFRSTYWYFGAHTGISDLIRVIQNLYMYFKSYTCNTELILVLRNLFLCEGTRRYDELVSTTGLILIRTSRRSYRVSSYAEFILITDVFSFGTPVGVTELIQIQEYP